MKIECIHGYFKFSETSKGQISHFVNRYGFKIERSGDHYTFSDLVDAPKHSIVGGMFLGSPTLFTFAGDPWEVMRENRLVYNFGLGVVMPLDLITQIVRISAAGYSFVTNGLILPGSITDGGKRVTDYSAFYSSDLGTFKYSVIEYD